MSDHHTAALPTSPGSDDTTEYVMFGSGTAGVLLVLAGAAAQPLTTKLCSPQTRLPSVLSPSTSTHLKEDQRSTTGLQIGNPPPKFPSTYYRNGGDRFTWNQLPDGTYLEVTDEVLRKDIVANQPRGFGADTSTWSIVVISSILQIMFTQHIPGALLSIASEVQRKRTTEILRILSLLRQSSSTSQDLYDFNSLVLDNLLMDLYSLVLDDLLMDPIKPMIQIAVLADGEPAGFKKYAFHAYGQVFNATLSVHGSITITFKYRWNLQTQYATVSFSLKRFDLMNAQGYFFIKAREISDCGRTEVIPMGEVRKVPPELEARVLVSRQELEALDTRRSEQ